MKKYAFLFVLATTTINSFAQEYVLDLSRFKDYKSDDKAHNRAIEGSSPILGHELAIKLKNTDLHPEDAYKKVLTENTDYEKQVYISSAAYFKTLHPGLDEYCSNKVVTGERSQWTSAKGNHGAAIPQEVIGPVTDEYIKNLDNSIAMSMEVSDEDIKTKAQNLANSFQEKRYQCPNVQKLVKLENKLEKYCLGIGFCVKSKKINSIISSAEAAYPRKQFSINGFTRYVYNELLRTPKLQEKIRIVYDLEKEWVEKKDSNQTEEKFFDYVIDEAIEKGVHIKDVMLILAYSMRNMPSLDVEYANEPKKALLLETYFWGFRDLRDLLSRKEYFDHVFPDHEFKRNPGFYHYLTAALLGCEARLSGLGHNNAILLGIGSKVGYKTDKLLKSLERDKMKNMKRKEKRKYIRSKMKQQGFWPGVAAGMHAARFGSKSCKSYKRRLKREYRRNKRLIRKEEDLSRKEKRELKRELKKHLKESYRSIINDYSEQF